MPHLVNLVSPVQGPRVERRSRLTTLASGQNEDPLMSEALVYNIKPGKTTVGNVEAEVSAAIRLSGSQILSEHCFFTNENGVVSLTALPDSTTVSPTALFLVRYRSS
jgi:hypothetical protein